MQVGGQSIVYVAIYRPSVMDEWYTYMGMFTLYIFLTKVLYLSLILVMMKKN